MRTYAFLISLQIFNSIFLNARVLVCVYCEFSVHGSAASLISGGSSLYGSSEDRQANEVRRLKRELGDARDQVMSLSSQLSSNVSRTISYLSLFIFLFTQCIY